MGTGKKGVKVAGKGAVNKGSKQTAPAASAAAAAQKEPGSKGKKKGKAAYGHFTDELQQQLAAIGLRVKNCTADGNCFFRALSDQLQGNESQHADLRQQVVKFMQQQEDSFAPFVEDDESFETYTARMRKDGVWAGHMELQAASLVLKRNIMIHQVGQPVWAINNFPNEEAPALHLSYHDGQHYNSVRMADDYSAGPADVVMRQMASGANGAIAKASGAWDEHDEQLVLTNTACDNPALVRKALDKCKGNVDAAIEYVIEVMASTADGGELPDGETAADAAAQPNTDMQEQTQQQQCQQQEQQQGHQCEATDVGVGVILCDGYAAAAGVAATGATSFGAAASTNGMVSRTSSGNSDEAVTTGSSQPEAAIQPAGPADSTSAAAMSAPSQPAPGQPSHPIRKCTKKVPASGKQARGAELKRQPRNKPCACGSGRKHKNCCGIAVAAAERRKAALQQHADMPEQVAAQIATLCI